MTCARRCGSAGRCCRDRANGAITKSPFRRPATSEPSSSTIPTNSWPIRRGSFVSVTPRYGQRSEPHTQAATTRTTASVGRRISGSGTSSTRMSRGAWMRVARTAGLLLVGVVDGGAHGAGRGPARPVGGWVAEHGPGRPVSTRPRENAPWLRSRARRRPARRAKPTTASVPTADAPSRRTARLRLVADRAVPVPGLIRSRCGARRERPRCAGGPWPAGRAGPGRSRTA